MPRLFIAIDVPAEVRGLMGLLQAGVPGAKWAPPDQLHLTLRFLGDVEGGAQQDLEEALTLVRAEAFQLSLSGVGHFPPRGAPKVLWAGAWPSTGLEALHAAVERATIAAGLGPEDRKFHPHVTLARLGREAPPRRVADWLSAHAAFEAGPFDVREFLLYSSVLGSRAASHRIEAAWPLGREAD